MIDGPYFVLITVGALAAGLVAGVCYAFSAFVMRGLGSLPPAQGAAAMNAINRAATTPAFMILFMGAAVLSAVAAVVTLVVWPYDGKAVLLVGSALYLIGVLGVTALANVPRNAALLRLDPGFPAAAVYWRRYLREWTLWNHVRVVAAAGAAVSYVLALT